MSAALDAALSGMLMHERGMDLISNNIANINTTGYKRAGLHFQDLLDTKGVLAALNGNMPAGGAVTSSGVSQTAVNREFTSGSLRPTQRDLDFAVNGDGMFRVQVDPNTVAYTRDGNFQLDPQGRVVTADGFLVQPPITVPADSHDLRVDNGGTITATVPFTPAELAALPVGALRDGKPVVLGRVGLTRFPNPAALAAIGNNLYRETPESQAPIDGFSGDANMGQVVNGFLESSNVDMSTEMTSLMLTSRAYSLNLNAYKTIEQMLSAANQLAG